ncbi:hypothetical protein [Pseudomonas fluorescens]|uniref:hypothetical protein n=1 Tax=Pseudomonas fluorescens TaxID=294 RepID=UPI001242F0E8|nr:hypothetical protein [Pseudomonas fluorescens]
MKNAIVIFTSLLILAANAYFLFSAESIPLKYMLTQSDASHSVANHAFRFEENDAFDLSAESLILKKVAPGSFDSLIIKRVNSNCKEIQPTSTIVAYTPSQESFTAPIMPVYIP